MTDEDEKISANPGYAFAQLAKALLGRGENTEKKVSQWLTVIEGMTRGLLQIGSRTPANEFPGWVTLEVIHGGFSTGKPLSGGPLNKFEQSKLIELGLSGIVESEVIEKSVTGGDRTVLNAYFSTDAGRAELLKIMKSGCYRVSVPEEAALLVAACLVAKNEFGRAEALLEKLAPFFDRLRFYPLPQSQPSRELMFDEVYLFTAGDCVKRLRAKKQQKSVLKMNETIEIWLPLYDQAVSLFLETVEGDLPELASGEDGNLLRAENGQPIAKGGYPCKNYPADWRQRAKSLLDKFDEMREMHILSNKPVKPKENFSRLRKYLAIACDDPEKLSIRDIGYIRKILASYVTAHGKPGSERLMATRAKQKIAASLPLHSKLAKLLANRLSAEPSDEGISDIEKYMHPLNSKEASEMNAVENSAIPQSLLRKMAACKQAPIDVLIKDKIITSGESLAVVLPLYVSKIRAARSSEKDFAQIVEISYRAFRKRRSLLLLNLEKQNRFEELPWIAALEPWIGAKRDSNDAAKIALTKVMQNEISFFPQTIIPNNLVKEFRALIQDAQLKLHLVDELAADIFMGDFSSNFLKCAQDAGRLLRGTLYERYYDIDYERILLLNDIEKKWQSEVSPGFAQICSERADGKNDSRGSPVARNGAIIEHAQIITTHNLATLWTGLELSTHLSDKLMNIAQDCFKWICKRSQFRISDWQANLRSRKNSAYAWRQMLFYLSLVSDDDQRKFIDWAKEHLEKQTEDFQTRFQPAFSGLIAIVGGERFDDAGDHESFGKRFLGWSSGKHFLD